MSATAYTPATLIGLVHDALKPWLVARKGLLAVAGDPYNFLELLAESPSGWRVTLHWAGEKNPGDNEHAGCFPINAFDVGISINPGLTATPDLAMFKPTADRSALLELVSDVRDFIRALNFAPGASTLRALYRGADPVALPNGVPLRAYRLQFEVQIGLDPVDTYFSAP
jgi:hypothetical protein